MGLNPTTVAVTLVLAGLVCLAAAAGMAFGPAAAVAVAGVELLAVGLLGIDGVELRREG